MSYDQRDTTSIAAENYGVSPSASAKANRAALQEALSIGGNVTLSTPGTYLIDDTLSPSVALSVGANVILQTQAGGAVKTLANSLRPLLPSSQGSTLAVIGDSFQAEWYFDDGNFRYAYAKGPVDWALALSQHRMTVVSSPAAGGSRVSGASSSGTAFDVQADTAIASLAQHAIIMGGVNDFFANFTVDTVKAAYNRVIEKLIAAGMTVWVCTQPTMSAAYSSYTVTRNASMFQLNTWLRQQVNSIWARHGVRLIDLAETAVDPSSTTGDYKSGYSYDGGLHPSNVGAYFMGKEIARVWSKYVPEANILVSSRADNYNYSSAIGNLIDNGLFYNGSGTATGFSGTAVAGGASTNSLVSRSDGIGQDQQMIVTSSANNDGYRLSTSSLHTRCASGDILQFCCEITVSSITNLRGVRLTADFVGTTTRGVADLYYDPSDDIALTEGFTAVMKTPPNFINGTPTSVVANLSINFSGAGGATVKVGRMSCRKLVQ